MIGIFVSLFVLFFIFAVNMALQYLRIGPWRDYRFGERVYLMLSLVAKSALAWQVFAGALAFSVPEAPAARARARRRTPSRSRGRRSAPPVASGRS